jgi:hypothetical protein
MTPRNSQPHQDRDRLSTGLVEDLPALVGSLRELIAESRQQVLRAVDVVQVQT